MCTTPDLYYMKDLICCRTRLTLTFKSRGLPPFYSGPPALHFRYYCRCQDSGHSSPCWPQLGRSPPSIPLHFFGELLKRQVTCSSNAKIVATKSSWPPMATVRNPNSMLFLTNTFEPCPSAPSPMLITQAALYHGTNR